MQKEKNESIAEECQGYCPSCDSLDIEWGEEDYEDDFIFMHGKCHHCGCDFKEMFKYSKTIY